MARTIRVSDETFKFIKASKLGEERDQDTLARLLNHKPTSASQSITDIKPAWVDEFRRELAREIKTAIESAMAR